MQLLALQLSELRHFHQDWYCTHNAWTNCNDIHINLAQACISKLADASPQSKLTNPYWKGSKQNFEMRVNLILNMSRHGYVDVHL